MNISVSYIKTVFWDTPYLKIGAMVLLCSMLYLSVRIAILIKKELLFKFPTEILGLILLGNCVLTYLLNLFVYKEYLTKDILLDHFWDLIVLPVSLFFLAESFSLDSEGFKKTINWAYIILSLNIIFGSVLNYILDGDFSLRIISINPLEKGVYHYHTIGDMLAIISIIDLNWPNKKIGHVLTKYLISVLLLYFSLSRTSLLLFGLLGFITVLRNIKNYKLTYLSIIAMIFVLIFVIILFIPFYYPIRSGIAYDRLISILNLTDSSMNTRLFLFSQFKNFLQSDYVISGAFMYEMKEGLGKGLYTHNLLSFWTSYGLIPFLLLAMWISLKLAKFNKALDKNINYPRFFVFLYGLFSILLSRSYIWPYFWFCLNLEPEGYKMKEKRTSKISFFKHRYIRE